VTLGCHTFCLFQPNDGRPDAGFGLMYTNMFDTQVDVVRAELDGKGYKDVDIVVVKTGWPHKGDPDEADATVENARAFVSGLVSHLRSLSGMLRAPGKSVETYIFTMYDEDLKLDKASERYFGLFQTSLAETYPTGLLRNGTARLTPATAPAPTTSAAALKPTLGQQPQVGLQYDTGCCSCFSLPEFGSLPSAIFFAECFFGHSAKKLFAECHTKNSR
jgi:hypothetical protein